MDKNPDKQDIEQKPFKSDCEKIIIKEEPPFCEESTQLVDVLDSIKYDSSDAESYTSDDKDCTEKQCNILKRKIDDESSEVPCKTTFQGKSSSDQLAIDSYVNLKYLKIFNLPVHWNENETNEWVEKECGTIKNFYFYEDEFSKFLGSILVTYEEMEHRDWAMEKLQDKKVDDKKLVLESYDSKEDPKIAIDLSGIVKKGKIRKMTWPPYLGNSFDVWAIDPSGYYGFAPKHLESLGIAPPIDRWIHVSNFKCNKEELKQLLELAGHVMICHLFTSPQMYAKVMYSHPIEAVQAVSMFNKQLFYGQPLMVVMDRYPSEHGILPEGMNKIGPGFGNNNKPLRNAVMQYERYLVGRSSTISPGPFRLRNCHLFYHDPIYSADPLNEFTYQNSGTVTFVPQCLNSQENNKEVGATNSPSSINKDSNTQQKGSGPTNQNFSIVETTSSAGQNRKPLLPDPIPQYKGWSVSGGGGAGAGANKPGLVGAPASAGLRGHSPLFQRPALFQKPFDPQAQSPPMRSQFPNPSGSSVPFDQSRLGNNYSVPGSSNPMFNKGMGPNQPYLNSNAGGTMLGPNFSFSGIRNAMIALKNHMATSNTPIAGHNVPGANPNYRNHGINLPGQNFPSLRANSPVAGFNNARFASHIPGPNANNISYGPNNPMSVTNSNNAARFGSNGPIPGSNSNTPNVGPNANFGPNNYRLVSTAVMHSFGNSKSNANAPLPVPPPNAGPSGPNSFTNSVNPISNASKFGPNDSKSGIPSNNRSNPNATASMFGSKAGTNSWNTSVRPISDASDSATSSDTSENFYTLKISNLPTSLGFIELCERISQSVENKSMISLQITSSGSATVKFSTKFDAECCLRKLNKTNFGSNVIDVQFV